MTMKNIVSFCLAVALLSTTLGSPLNAQGLTKEKVNVVFVEGSDSSNDSGKELPPLNHSTQQSAKSEIDGNADLKAILQSQNVELNNVVGIETAADGGKIVYVK
jgi:hypothetical protein